MGYLVQMKEKKRELRYEILKKRDNLSRKQVESKSEKIEKGLFALPDFQRAKTVMFYVSFRSEVETDRMIKKTLSMGKRVVLPAVDGERMVLAEVKNFEKELTEGRFGIREPKKEFRRRVDTKQIDLVVVPGVVFDRWGGRIGYGRGYYDRFLRSKSMPSRRGRWRQGSLVGLAFDLQIARKIPLGENDVRVDKIITESRVINCRD